MTWHDVAFPIYQAGGSIIQAAAAAGVHKMTVFRALQKAGLLREKVRLPSVEFNGVKYTKTKHGYLRATGHKARQDSKLYYLHRAVLAAAEIEIPAGFEVHHKNEDRADNRLDNLAVLPFWRHREIHAAGD